MKVKPKGFELTENVSPGLVEVENPLPTVARWFTPWQVELTNYSTRPDEVLLTHNLFNQNDADGRYLILQGGFGFNPFFLNITMVLFISVVISMLTLTMSYHSDGLEIGVELITTVILIFLTILSHVAYKIVPVKNVFIFDRDSGNVLFPKKLFRKRLIIPFSHVVAMVKRVTARSSVSYHVYLFSKLNRKRKRRYKASLNIGSVIFSGSSLEPWHYICAYMNKRFLPETFAPFEEKVRWYNNNEITMPEYYTCARPWFFQRFPVQKGYRKLREDLSEAEYHRYRDKYFKLIDNVRSLTKTYFCKYSGNYFIPWKLKLSLVFVPKLLKYSAMVIAFVAFTVILPSIYAYGAALFWGMLFPGSLLGLSLYLYTKGDMSRYAHANYGGVYALNGQEVKDLIIDKTDNDLWSITLKGVDYQHIGVLDVSEFHVAKKLAQ